MRFLTTILLLLGACGVAFAQQPSCPSTVSFTPTVGCPGSSIQVVASAPDAALSYSWSCDGCDTPLSGPYGFTSWSTGGVKTVSVVGSTSGGSANFTGSAAINDASCTPAVASLTVSGMPAKIPTGMTVTINSLTHTWDNDIIILLVSPGGAVVELSAYTGGSGDNYSGTTFSDAAGSSIYSGSAPFSGTFQPSGMTAGVVNLAGCSIPAYANRVAGLNGLAGGTANGTWSLVVFDRVGGDVGTIDDWTLNFPSYSCNTASNMLPIIVPPANVSVSTPTTSSLNVYWDAATAVTQYQIGYRVNGGITWNYTAPFTPSVVTGQPTRRFRTLTGLQFGTYYDIVVRSYNSSGCTSVNSTTVNGVTNPQGVVTCRVPTGVYAEDFGGNVYFIWTPGSNAMCTSLSYGPGTNTALWTTVNTANGFYNTTLAPGTYGFRLRSNCANCNATSSQLSAFTQIFYVTVTGQGPREGGENVLSAINAPSFSVYPNPSRGAFTLKADGIEENTPVQIYDMTGKIVYETATIENGETNFDLSDKPAGVYLLKAGAQSLKVIIE